MLTLAVVLSSALATAPPAASGHEHVGLAASFEREASGGEADVVVRFMPLEAGIHVNADPPPRLTLDPDQRVLDDSSRPAPPPPRAAFPNGRYLDTQAGVRLPVRMSPMVPKGRHTVRAAVLYFYCSQAEGWCRRAQDEVEVSVTVP